MQRAFVVSLDGCNERREISRSQSLLADQNNRRVAAVSARI